MTLSAEMKSRLKRIWNVSTSIIVALAILLAVLLVGFRLFGFQIYTVLSGSMEPKYPVGSLVYVRKIEPEKLEVGDDISFLVSDKTVVTHRIVEILPDEDDPDILRFRTQGIANNVTDAPVHENNVIGKVAFHIPLLGFLSHFVQGPGRYITVFGASLLILITFLPDILRAFKQLSDEKNQEEEGDDEIKTE